MSSNIGKLDLNYVPSTTQPIFLKCGEGCISSETVTLAGWGSIPKCSDLFQNGIINNQFKSYSEVHYFISDAPDYIKRASIQVVPKSILNSVENSWKSLIDGTKGLIQNQISTLNDIFKLNVLGVGMIASSAIGLYYTKPENTKTRMGLQALFFAGLVSVLIAAFKANSSINSLQRL